MTARSHDQLGRGFYAILDLEACGSRPILDVATALLSVHPVAIQVRAKRQSARELYETTLAIKSLAVQARCPLIVNDRLDVALAAGANGVHLGQDDLPLAHARKLVPPNFSIGISTHAREEARHAELGGATLIGFGPIFATRTKENPSPVQGLLALAEVVSTVSIPVVAIGGITPSNARDVARTGCAAATSIAGVLQSDDPARAAAAIAAAFSR
ncbi:MAG: thiamine phosphate synthase [Deltaproteobacteria bacterium]|nr:thiamine phosphate synthase [Deltaproteobacteria bacterium]